MKRRREEEKKRRRDQEKKRRREEEQTSAVPTEMTNMTIVIGVRKGNEGCFVAAIDVDRCVR